MVAVLGVRAHINITDLFVVVIWSSTLTGIAGCLLYKNYMKNKKQFEIKLDMRVKVM
jgi:hypothetical protein